eukprot:comp23677_c0_seq5/m.40540 comp23677_c0_seq5/g.40540  ORF comp23677_c0_seq5/g.40540 comp23677_c0_seq5/m.40540 type:complete len:718 (-) comp23677_c0_seq5:437-2590(-)
MAEAHAAVHLLSSEIPGQKPTKIVLQQDDDDIFSISFRKSFIRFLRMMKRRVYDFRNELKNAIFPHSWFSYFFSVCAPPAVMMSARAGNLPGIRAIRQGLWGFANQLPSWAGQRIGRVAITSAVAGTGVFFSLLVLRRMALRTLLSYRGWLYQQPRTQSKRVLLWGALVQALTGRHPLLFSFSRSLPQLPVPGLKDTVDRYLTSIESVLPPAEVAKNKSLAAAFLRTEGPRLQRYLVLKSWLADNYVTDWWERYVYLFPRAPILINSNYYVSDVVNIIPTHHPCSRAAGLISAILRFKQSVDRETLEPLVIRDTVPLCMEQYRRMFSTTRIPKKGGDQILHLDRNESRHIVVFVKGSYFVLELYSDLGKPLHAFEIEGQLERIAEEASTKEPSATEQQVAALTGLDRDKWAEAREVFFSHGVNRQSLELIEKAMFVLVLDSEAPDTLTEHGKLSLHGKGFDRWFDKSFNLIVYANGKELHLRVMCFDEFGKGLMKQCRVSPDGFIQQALQLAYYKQNKVTPLTYESSMTRLYLHGRTETVRSATMDSKKWVLSMFDESVAPEERMKLFQKACGAHQDRYRDAMSGLGVDRHLFALYVVSQGLGVDSEFLKHALKEPWRLSTSQQPQQQTTLWDPSGKDANMVCCGGGFGPVADDGYGVSYMVAGEDILFFHVSSKKTCPTTDSDKFADDIRWALREIRGMLEACKSAKKKQADAPAN